MEAGRLTRAQPLIRFGPFEADLASCELRKHGIKVKLQDLPFRLLVCLLERPGEVVTREELQASLWPTGTFVDFERGLRVALNKLREALCDSAAEPRFIETIPRRGCRFLAEVEKIEAPGPDPIPAVPPAKQKVAVIAGGVIALFAVVGALGLRTHPAPLTDRDTLVLADFANSTGDSVFDGVMRDALAVQLEQSPFLKVLDDEVVRQDLQLMRHSPQQRITNELAHDICVREAEKAMLAGSIAALGKSYAIELKATNCQTGATLARQEAQAPDKEHVLRALAKAAEGIRQKLGESLSSIQKLAPPELPVTSSSLDAFQAYTTGQRLFDETRFVEAIPFLRRATELDPNFAFAWAWLASASLNTGGGADMARVIEYSDRAWALRDRTSAYERLRLTGTHFHSATGEFEKAIETYELWKRTYPRDPVPFGQEAIILDQEGKFEEALRNNLEASRLAPRRPIFAPLVMADYIKLDRFAEAKGVAEKHFAQGFDIPKVHESLLTIAWMEGDSNGVSKQLRWFTGTPEEHIAMEDQAAHARMVGQLRRSHELLELAARLARQRNLPDVARRLLAPNVNGEAYLGNCEPARKVAAITPAALALCSDVAAVHRAERDIEERSNSSPNDTLWNGLRLPVIRASLEFGQGRPAHAIDQLKSVQFDRAYPFATYLRGLAFLRMKKGTEAATEFQKIVDHKGANWGPMYPLSYLGLARGAALAGETARSRGAYEGFLAMWKDADPDLPLLIQARKEYAALSR
jgi:DNA-binding winged helix-turn-helix (wHTH) protein/tetratricopeptide (TPR) repeat protein